MLIFYADVTNQEANLYSCSDTGEAQPTAAESSKPSPVMALFRGLRRRLRQLNPCTTCLVVLFLAVVFYLISAIRGSYFRLSADVTVADGYRDAVGPGVGDRRRLSALGGNDVGPSGQRRRRKDRTGSFIVGDDDIQLCKMTSRWASSVVEQQDYLNLSVELPMSNAARKRQDGLSSCSAASADPVSELFYVDADGRLKYNQTAAAGGNYEAVGSCTAWTIEWNFDTGYVEKNASLPENIDADFIHVRCRVRRNINDEHRTPRAGRRNRSEHHLTIADIAERRARQMHRDQLRRRSPHFVGTVGLPDPLSDVIAKEKTSENADESEEQASQNEPEVRPRRNKQSPGFATRADQSKPAEHNKLTKGRKLDVQSLSRFQRDLNQRDERSEGENATEIYDQLIARIHPLKELVDRDAAGDQQRHSDRLDVLVLALESMSSIAFDRYLQKSHRFLRDQPHTVFFTGYNVIGDAAPANIIPMLTGWREFFVATFTKLCLMQVRYDTMLCI